MAYGVIESTNMKSIHRGGRIYDAIADVDIENGTVGYIDELADGETHIYTFHKGVKAGKTLVIVDQPVWDADTSKRTNQRKDKFICKAEIPFRVRKLYADDEFAISAECIDKTTRANIDINKFVTVNADGKFVVADATNETAIFEGKVMRKRTQGATLLTTAHTYGYSRYLYTVKVARLVAIKSE